MTRNLSLKHRQKISRALRGRKLSLETKLKISQSKEGHKTAEYTRKKISESLTGHRFSLETLKKLGKHRLGTHHSEETRRKISRANLGRPSPNKGKSSWNRGLKCPLKDPTKQKIGIALKGKPKPPVTESTRAKLRELRLKQVFPQKDSTIEVLLQEELQKNNIDFCTHVPMEKCQPDIYLPDHRICIFVDGCWWHGCPIHFPAPNDMQRVAIKKDLVQEQYLESKGLTVFRFWEHDINSDIRSCVIKIRGK